ncbi:MAG: IS256 family transposase [Candidatus Aminicenantes bacterium]|jgi:transposase-like protein
MVLDRAKLKKLLKEKGVKSLDDFNAFMRDVSKDVIETLLEEELTDHLGFEKHDQKAKTIDNSRNGYTPKTVKSKFGEIGLDVPRDRKSEFEPQVVKKRKKDIAGLEDKIISMYAKGMTTRDIQAHIKDLYSYEISPETVSSITDKVIERAREWQSRPLEPIYAVVYMDAVFLKMRTEGHVRNVALYTIIGINLDGRKESLGLWVCETESAKYWLSVLNELKNRGLEDVLIFSVDNLKGISEAIEAVYPQAEVQKCIIHQIRNSLRYVSWKERKAMAKDLRLIYEAATEEEGSSALDDFAEKWDKRYPHVSASWKKNWAEISTFFKYPPEIRTLIYTTNPIESLHRQIKKVSKNKSSFPNEQALIKLVYLAVEEAARKWTMRHRDWAMIYSQLMIFFEDRVAKYV